MSRHKMLITIASVLVGFMFILVLKTQGVAGNQTARPETSLVSLLQIELENEQLSNDNASLREEYAKFEAGQNAASLAAQQLNQSRINAGLTEMKGTGIVITLNDSERDVADDDPNKYVIHEEYLRQLVNILWNGGAEAISINDQRITTKTEIFCSGAFIQINSTRQMPPYVIRAIGDQRNLQSSLKFYLWDRLGDYQEQYGIKRLLEVPDQPITIPAGKLPSYRFAEPVKEGI